MNPEQEPDLFSWSSPYVRASDPETSHEAARELDVKGSSLEALGYFLWLNEMSNDGITATEFEQYVEKRLQWEKDRAHRKAESLRRRLTDLEKKYGKLEVRKDDNGRVLKRGKQQIYYLVS